MVFNAVLFILVLITTGIFLYLSFALKRKADKDPAVFEGRYQIEIAEGFSGESLSIYVNDSLLMNRTLSDSIVRLEINRFAEEHVLMIVDNKTDNAIPFNLSKEGGKVKVSKAEGEVIVEETP